MNLLPYETAELSPNFTNTIELSYPHSFYGFLINSVYDENRLKINSKFNPKYYSIKSKHNYKKMYGIVRPLDVKYKFLLSELYHSENCDNYTDILKEYGLFCKDNYRRYDLNLYPIDNSFYNEFMYKDLYTDDLVEYTGDIPMFQRIAHVGLYLVGNFETQNQTLSTTHDANS